MLTPLLYGLALASGFAALVYQVAWSHLLALTFGSSTLAASAVVAGFLGGMGIGAWRYHRVAARVERPLVAYAGLELGIAASTAAFTALFAALPELFAGLAGAAPPGLVGTAARVAAVLLLLLVPCALMGATYPALCIAGIHSRQGLDRHLGPIYGLNTLGAALGAAAAGFVLLEWLGTRGAIALANGVNLAVAAAAWFAARPGTTTAAEAAAALRDEPLPSRLPAWATAVLLAGAGATTIAYEVVWFRALRYVVGNSTYAISASLAIFLLGLGIGGMASRGLLRAREAERTLAWIQLATALLAAAALAGIHALLAVPGLRDSISIFSESLAARPWPVRLATGAGAAAALLLPATLCMGLTFPLASRLYLGRVGALGARVGGAYLHSNLGSIAGALAAALLLLPRFGVVGSVRLLMVVNGALAVGVLLAARRPAALPRALAAAAACGAALLALPARLPFAGEPLIERFVPRLLFEREEEIGTVQVWTDPQQPDRLAMAIDGSLIATSAALHPALYAKQVLLAHLPLAVDPGARRVLSIGVASGSTHAALAAYPELTALDAVEINPAVLAAARWFPESQALADPRSQVVVEDAIHYLLRARRDWDLIVSDAKQNKDFSGNGRILSLEFYRFALARLAPCGIFAQWIPLSNAPEGFTLILRTFLAAFPEVELFADAPESLYMLGSRCPLAERGVRTQADYEARGLAAQLGPLGFPTVADLLALWVTDGAGLAARLGPGAVNDWNRMPLSYASFRARPSLRDGPAANLALLIGAGDGAGRRPSPFEAPGSPFATSRPLVQEAHLLRLQGETSAARRRARAALAANPADAAGARVLRALRTITIGPG